MKKNLLVMAAVLMSASVNAQSISRVNAIANGNQMLKDAKMASTLVEAPKAMTAKKIAKAAPADDIFGGYLQIELAHDESISTSQPVTMEAANVQDNEGNTYNVKLNDFWRTGTVMYGNYNETTGELVFPIQTISESTKSLGYVNEYGSLEIYGIKAGNLVSQGDIVFKENNGNFELVDTLRGYYIYAPQFVDENTGEEGTGWTYAFDARMVRYNGMMSFTTTATEFQTTEPREGSTWAHGEMQVNIDDFETSIVVNGFLGSGCVQIDLYDDGTCEMQMGQELEATEYPDNCGRMRLIADAQLEGGKIQADQSIEYISGDYVRNVAEINGDVFRFFGVDDEGNFTYNNYLMPAALDSEGKGYWMGGHFCAFEFVLYHGDATGIEEQHMTLEQKLKSAKTYNMLGQRVDRAQTKGLLVRNGKKFLSK